MLRKSQKDVEEIIREEIAKRTFSASAFIFASSEKIVLSSYQGTIAFEMPAFSVDEGMLFDLASLTKVLSTTTIVARCLERGLLDLDQDLSTLGNWAPQWEDEILKRISLRDLLSHQAGFLSWKDIGLKNLGHSNVWQQTQAYRKSLLREIRELPVDYQPRSKTVYSDFGFILLGEYLVQKMKMSLDEIFKREITENLRLDGIMFHPLEKGYGKHQIVATEFLKWRGGLLHGVVHDDHAFLLYGEAGHAGLFGSAISCVRIAQEWLRALEGKSSLLREKTASVMIEKSTLGEGEPRGLGWALPSPGGSSAGRFVSPRAFGHLGYTGTSLWIDPDRKEIICWLTNRVHGEGEPDHMKVLRPRIHECIWR